MPDRLPDCFLGLLGCCSAGGIFPFPVLSLGSVVAVAAVVASLFASCFATCLADRLAACWSACVACLLCGTGCPYVAFVVCLGVCLVAASFWSLPGLLALLGCLLAGCFQSSLLRRFFNVSMSLLALLLSLLTSWQLVLFLVWLLAWLLFFCVC